MRRRRHELEIALELAEKTGGSVSFGGLRLEKMKPGERKCPKCGRESWPHCPYCGGCREFCCNIGVGLCPEVQKKDDEDLREYGRRRCPRCKWVVGKENKVCGHCRLPVSKMVFPKSAN